MFLLISNLDLSFEVRAAQGRKNFYQSFISLHIKIDKWVEFFAIKLKELGVGTVKATSKVIEKTVDMTNK